jgi:hypothetical protein
VVGASGDPLLRCSKFRENMVALSGMFHVHVVEPDVQGESMLDSEGSGDSVSAPACPRSIAELVAVAESEDSFLHARVRARAVGLARHLACLDLRLRRKGDAQREGAIDAAARGCDWRCGCAGPTGRLSLHRLLLVATIVLFRFAFCRKGDAQREGAIDAAARDCDWRCGCAGPTGRLSLHRLLLVATIVLFRFAFAKRVAMSARNPHWWDLDTPKVFCRPGTSFRYRREPPSKFHVCP